MIEAQKMDPEIAEANPIIPSLTREVSDNIINVRDLEEIGHRVESIAHQIKYEYDGGKLPEYVEFGNRRIRIPRNLSMEPAGAFLASRNVIAEECNKAEKEYGENWKDNWHPSLESMALVLAHYFYYPVTGKAYREQDAEAFVTQVHALPLSVALPVARSFFLNYPNLLQQKIKFWDRLRQSWRNARALSRLKRSGSIMR